MVVFQLMNIVAELHIYAMTSSHYISENFRLFVNYSIKLFLQNFAFQKVQNLQELRLIFL